MAHPSDFARRYLAASSLPGLEPLFDDFAIGHPITMGIEVLLTRLLGLRLVEPPVFLGAAVRGPKSVCVAWDA